MNGKTIGFSGVCTCGHSFDMHHHSMILAPEILGARGEEYRNVSGVMGQECEHSWLNGQPMHEFTESDPECTCGFYQDKEWPSNEGEESKA